MRRRNVAFAFAVLAAVMITAMVRAGGGRRRRPPGSQREVRSPLRPAGKPRHLDRRQRLGQDLQHRRGCPDLRLRAKYLGLEGTVIQAHIHFGKHAVNGGITVFLCGTAAAPGPAGTPVCPPDGGVEAVVSRTVVAAGIPPTRDARHRGGKLGRAPGRDAERTHHANVHSTKWPGGEIRAQISPRNARH